MPALYGGGICGDLIQRAERSGPYSAQYDNQSPMKLAAANIVCGAEASSILDASADFELYMEKSV